MDYLDYVLNTPYSWVTLAGFLCGASVSRMTTRPTAETEGARGMKWAGVYLLFSLAVVSGTLAVFIPDASLILDLRLVYQFGGALALGALALRFKLIIGSVAFLGVAALAIATVLIRQYWTPVSPGETVALVRVLAQNEGQTTLEFAAGDDPSGVDDVSILELPGAQFGVRSELFDVSPHYFFLGMGAGVRFVELLGSGGPAYQFPDATGTSARFDALVRRIRAPGLDFAEASSDLIAGRVLQRYHVIYQPTNPLEIRAVP